MLLTEIASKLTIGLSELFPPLSLFSSFFSFNFVAILLSIVRTEYSLTVVFEIPDEYSEAIYF